jgi:hypothetical protein
MKKLILYAIILILTACGQKAAVPDYWMFFLLPRTAEPEKGPEKDIECHYEDQYMVCGGVKIMPVCGYVCPFKIEPCPVDEIYYGDCGPWQ